MKLLIVLAAAATLGSSASFAADSAPAGGKGACKADVQKFCNGVEHANGKIRACLTEHVTDLSDTCKQRVASWASKPAAN